ncbi:MAG: hypothetical protein ACLQVM_25105 [Terriglobia bacterium]
MSCEDRVDKVVSAWAHLPGAPDDGALLSTLWKGTHIAAPFQPDAVDKLIHDLQDEFKTPPTKVIKLKNTNFDPGSIKTVGDLHDAVCETP